MTPEIFIFSYFYTCTYQSYKCVYTCPIICSIIILVNKYLYNARLIYFYYKESTVFFESIPKFETSIKNWIINFHCMVTPLNSYVQSLLNSCDIHFQESMAYFNPEDVEFSLRIRYFIHVHQFAIPYILYNTNMEICSQSNKANHWRVKVIYQNRQKML